jgi:hypothetical protein
MKKISQRILIGVGVLLLIVVSFMGSLEWYLMLSQHPLAPIVYPTYLNQY